MKIIYTHADTLGNIYRTTFRNVASWADETYPPGGFLRVMRNEQGQIIGGPLVSELLTWEVKQDDAPTCNGSV